MKFYDIHEQTKYQVVVSRPENAEDLSDLFLTEEELLDMVGENYYLGNIGNNPRTITLNSVITADVKKWTDKLEESGKKTLRIEDEDLLEVLKQGYITNYTSGDDRFGRHGDRICYARRYKRVKKKATQGDVRNLWIHVFQCAFRSKYGCYMPHIPTYDRHLSLFKAMKDILGWRRCRKFMGSREDAKFYRQIWDNPEEFIK